MIRRLTIFSFLITTSLFSESKEKQYVEIIFNDGHRETGRIVSRSGNSLVLENNIKKIWFNKKLIKEIVTLEESNEIIIYRRRKEGSSNRERYTPDQTVFRHLERLEDDSIKFTADDPKKGEIEDILEVKRFTANTCFLDAIKYQRKMGYNDGLIWKYFNELPAPQNFNEKLDRVKFLRQGQRLNEASAQLNLIETNNEKEKAAIERERKRISDQPLRLQAEDDLRTQRFAPRKKDLSSPSLNDNTKEHLLKWWSNGASTVDVESLTRTLNTQNIDLNNIINELRSFDVLEATPKVGLVEERHWDWEGEARHYSVYVPNTYDPNKLYSCFVVLHGASGNDDNMIRNFLSYAEKYKLILISPEYIYGRKWGYYYSRQDVHAVIGALYDARLHFSIDPSRTYLMGWSQGGHTTFDVTQSFVNEFAGSVPIIGAPYRVPTQLAHQKHYPMYIIGGEFDWGAPAQCRKAIKRLLKFNSPSIYVEYKDRAHDVFQEQWNNTWLFLSNKRRPQWTNHVEAYWARKGEGARQWLRVPDHMINNEEVRAISKSSLLNLKGDWKNHRIKIRCDKRLKEFEVLIPDHYTPSEKKPLKIVVNGKVIFKENIKGFNLEDYLNEVSRTKDRWTPVRQVIKVDLRKKKKK